MKNCIDQIVEEFRNKGYRVSDADVELVTFICNAKIKLCNLQEDYMEVLFPDELRNHIIRREITEITLAACRSARE